MLEFYKFFILKALESFSKASIMLMIFNQIPNDLQKFSLILIFLILQIKFPSENQPFHP